tara:strand:+ start:604 stop:1080 length:477 start_codon:yes stop_codon:yes gene_type:complete
MKNTTIFELKTIKVLVIIGALFLVYSQAFAASNSQVGRYSTVENKPTIAQVNPLLSVQKMHFPSNARTVGDAVRYWIRFSGYALVSDKNLSKEASTLLKQPLPVVDKHLGPLSVKDGVEVLMGQGVFHLVQDPLNRKLDFKLNKKYIAVYSGKSKRSA